MPKTRLISPGSIPNHKLLKNLQLQGNFISNDGGDEGLTVTNGGATRVSHSFAIGHSGTGNLILNGNYVSNDGGSEGITVDNDGAVTLSSNLDVTSGYIQAGLIYVASPGGTHSIKIDNNSGGEITWEGATNDAHETILTAVEPTQDNTISLPDVTGTVLVTPSGGADIHTSGNIALNGEYISNDGGDEGISIQDDGDVIINGDTKLYLNDAGGEYLNSDGTDLSIASGRNVNILAAGGVVTFATGDTSEPLLVQTSTKTGSSAADSTAHIQETLSLGSGEAGGSDVHYGFRYTQTQIDVAGWNSVYLMHLSGGTAAKTFAVQGDGKVGIGVADPDTTLEILSTSTQLKLSYDATDYCGITVGANGYTTITTNDTDGTGGTLLLNPNGGVLIMPQSGAGTLLNYGSHIAYYTTTKTASTTTDRTCTFVETLNLGAGEAGGSDTHYGVYYTQIQTDIAGWDNVYLMYFTGGTAAKTFVVQADGKVGIGEVAPQDTLEVNGTVLVKDALKFTQDDGNEFIDSQNDGYLDIGATTAIRLEAPTLCEDKLYFTQTDGNEFIDSQNDGYLDIGATTAIRLEQDTIIESTKKLYFNDAGGEYISGNGTNLTITSGAKATIDAGTDIVLSADGGNVTMDDGTNTIFDFDTDNTDFTIYDDEDTDDYFRVDVNQNASTNISTNDDSGGDLANLEFELDGDMIIDRNYAVADSSTHLTRALHIDFDRTGASTGNNTMWGLHIEADSTTAEDGSSHLYGIKCDATFTHAEDAGTARVYGGYFTATGGTNGNGTAYGIRAHATGGESNIGLYIDCADGGDDLKIVSSAASADYFLIQTIEDGETTISTVENGGGATAHLTLDVDGDLILDPVSGITKFYDAGDDAEFASITVVGGTGATTIATESASADGHLTLDADGDIKLEPASGNSILLDGTIDIDAGVVTGATSITSTTFVGALTGNASGTAATVTGAAQTNITSLGTLTALVVDDVAIDGKVVQITGDTNDTFTITTGAHGATTLVTHDNAAEAGHLTLTVDGKIDMNSVAGQDIVLDSGDDIMLDAAGEDIIFMAGGTTFGLIDMGGAAVCELTSALNYDLKLASMGTGDLILDPASTKVIINATDGLYLDGGGDTYIYETSADLVIHKVGGDSLLTMDENGDDGNQVWFKDSCAGFVTIEESFSDDSIIGSGSSHDTHIDFRHSNKISLAVIADVTNMNLIFPAMSANFVLLLTYDGDHDITNWKVYENDESAADGDADVLWPGGTAPATTASGVDIFSFYWDVVSEKCYGVGSLDFSN